MEKKPDEWKRYWQQIALGTFSLCTILIANTLGEFKKSFDELTKEVTQATISLRVLTEKFSNIQNVQERQEGMIVELRKDADSLNYRLQGVEKKSRPY